MEDDDILKLSIKELKSIVNEARITIPPGIEKSELVSLAKRALQTKSSKSPTIYSTVKVQGCKLEECESVFVFFHGYGADEHQFDFLTQSFGPKTAYLSPKSPQEGWFPLDPMEWMMAMSNPEILQQKMLSTPRGLVEARNLGLSFLKDVKRRAPKTSKLAVCGFSQGGVMALDLALNWNMEETIYAGVFSAYPVNIEVWRECAKRGNAEVFVTHGEQDPLIPFAALNVIKNVLDGNVKYLETHSHPGAHTIGNQQILTKCLAFFKRVIK
jgi:phospholipase/carboxylesterase